MRNSKRNPKTASAEEIQQVTCTSIAFGFGEVLDAHDAIARIGSAAPRAIPA